MRETDIARYAGYLFSNDSSMRDYVSRILRNHYEMAARKLVRIGAPVVSILIDSLYDEDPAVRELSVWALDYVGWKPDWKGSVDEKKRMEVAVVLLAIVADQDPMEMGYGRLEDRCWQDGPEHRYVVTGSIRDSESGEIQRKLVCEVCSYERTLRPMDEPIRLGIEILYGMYEECPDIPIPNLQDIRSGRPLLRKELILEVVKVLSGNHYWVSKKHLLKLEQGYTLEFYHVNGVGDLLTRLISPDSEPSPWVISDRDFVIGELTRTLGKRTERIEEFANLFSLRDPRVPGDAYDRYPVTAEQIKSFGVFYKEADYESVSMDIVVISVDKIAYWVSVGLSGIRERGWVNFENLMYEIERVRKAY